MISAFGIEHEYIEKRKKGAQTQFGRDLAGAAVPGLHGAVAGRKGRKFHAAAYEVGGGLLVGPVGSGIGTHLASQKGYYKPLRTAGQ